MKIKNNNKNGDVIISMDLQKQRDYIKKLLDEKFDFGLVFANAFVRGMRDIGYKSSATAVNELIDNAVQAEADRVHVVFGYDSQKQKKPDKIAVVDNGHGMDPLMIRAAVLWGGTHRENDRSGFGRYGYGLPSASVSIGEVYTVYSKTPDGDWNSVTIDLKAIGQGMYRNEHGHVIAPEPQPAELPNWVIEYLDANKMKNLQYGTVVVISKVDRLSFSTAERLRQFFLEQFGVTYRNFIRQVSIYVDGKAVEPIDPLFTTEGFRFYDIDEDRAEPLPPLNIEVKDPETKEVAGIIKVRFSYMPWTFLRVPQDKLKEKGGKNNERFPIRRDNNGIIVLRAGRQIDVVDTKCPWTKFQNNDKYVGVEVDFPPVLDEEFSITTSKQQVGLSSRIWDILKNNGVYEAIQQMRNRYDREGDAIKEKRGPKDEKRPSEQAMEESQKLLTQTPLSETPEKQKESLENLERRSKEKSKETGVPAETVKKQMLLEAQEKPFKVEFVEHPGAPFYRVEQVGGQKVLYVNRAHRFYSDVYAGPNSTYYSKAGLEVLLFVLGDCELRANADTRLVYRTEKAEWSKYLDIALEKLSKWENIPDNYAAELEAAESTAIVAEQQAAL